MEIVVSGASLMANRAVLVGPNPEPANDPSKRIRLNLIYTGLSD